MRPALAVVFAAASAALAQTPPPETAASPVPAEGMSITGWIDVGARWRSGVGGSFDAYRSFVNLGGGPKLMGSEITVTDPARRWFDEVRVSGFDWGGEPNSTLRVDVRKAKLYEFSADYRDIAFFDALPSYADPLLARGIALNEQAFDTRRRFAHFEIALFPSSRIVPYAAYDRDSGSGDGVSTFVANADEFAVPALFRNRSWNFRGGVRLALRRFHATLEQGGTRFEDDQTLYQSGGVNFGNSLAPVAGQTIALTDLLAAYGARGSGVYSRALVTASPVSWADFAGQFLFSQPDTHVTYRQYDGGNLYLQDQAAFFTAQQYMVSSAAQAPHATGMASAEMRPWRRIRLTQSWLTDRLHAAAPVSSNQMLTGGSIAAEQNGALLQSSLASNYSQVEAMLYFDAASRLTLRGGYRYVWGDAMDLTLPPEGLASSDRVRMRRNVGIGGFSYRPVKKLSLSAEGESGSSGGAYFRTSLYDYQKIRAQARFQAAASLSFSAGFSLLNNQDPQPGIASDFLTHRESLSVLWAPGGGKLLDLQGSYSRSDLRSDIGYFDPGTLQPVLSRYRDNSHAATALIRLQPRGAAPLSPQIVFGGSLLISSGSRPTTYYQPEAKLFIPTSKHLALFGEWRYFGYGEAFYLYEGFRAHLLSVGLRYSR